MPAVRENQAQFRALGVSGAPAAGRLTTCFALGDGLVVDTGALVHGQAPAESAAVTDILLSHSHLDHTLGLPFRLGHGELRVWGLKETLDAVRQHLLGGDIWPDLSATASWNEVQAGAELEVAGWKVHTHRCSHTVPCLAFALERGGRKLVIVGDTRVDEGLMTWVASQEAPACVVECSFPDRVSDVAVRFGHQTPRDLRSWRAALGSDTRMYVTHVKPSARDETLGECRALQDAGLTVLEQGDAFPL